MNGAHTKVFRAKMGSERLGWLISLHYIVYQSIIHIKNEISSPFKLRSDHADSRPICDLI